MRDLAKHFLSVEQNKQIESAVTEAEKNTSGEIVCMIQSTSYRYPMANVLGATTLALPPALVLTPLIGGYLWLGTQNMWLFLSIFCLLYLTAYLLVQHTPALKRYFISQREIDEEAVSIAYLKCQSMVLCHREHETQTRSYIPWLREYSDGLGEAHPSRDDVVAGRYTSTLSG